MTEDHLRRVNWRIVMIMIPKGLSEDRTREYCVPPNLTAWMSKEHLTRLAWRLARTVDTGEIEPIVSLPDGKVFEPQMLLSVMVYSYAVGVLGSCSMEQSILHDENVRHLCAGLYPDCNSVCEFRSKNRETIKRCLETVYLVAWKIRFGTWQWHKSEADGRVNFGLTAQIDPLLRSQISFEAGERLRRAEHLDKQSLGEQIVA